MIAVAHGKPATTPGDGGLVAVARLFYFSNATHHGYGAMTPQGFVAVKYWQSSPGDWWMYWDRRRVVQLTETRLANGRRALVGAWMMAWLTVMQNPDFAQAIKKRRPAATLYASQLPPPT